MHIGWHMNATQRFEHHRVKALRTKRHAIDARAAVFGKTAALHRGGIGLQRDLGISNKGQRSAQHLQHLADVIGCKQAGRAATHEHADHRSALHGGQLRLKISSQRVQISAGGQSAVQRKGVEVAVRALAHTPRKVHVERERGRDQRKLPGQRASNDCSAWPR